MTQIEKKWIVAERLDDDLLTHLLKLRGVDSIDDFFNLKFPDHLHDPYLMKDLGKVVDRLLMALKKGEVIGVFSDYDTDGTPGAALFIDGLRKLGARVKVVIPTRTEGYGLSEQGLKMLAGSGAKVVVTIDLGITGLPYVALAKDLGMDLIITDHHVVQDDLFPIGAYAVVNPKQTDCQYPFKELCGGGIIWKVLSALTDRVALEMPERLNGSSAEAINKWALDLAAISTICDMVPLVGENRLIAHYGLMVMRKTRRPGIKALLKTSGTEQEKVSATTVGFQIGPRINAPTRLAAEAYTGGDLEPQGSLALGLLLAENDELAQRLAQQLHDYNHERQNQLEDVLKEAIARVENEGLASKKLIFLAGAGWPAGIVGLVAGRLMERFGRPAIVLGIDGEEAVGSARSVDGFHLVDALAHCSANIKKFGGHSKAAGLTIEKQHLESVYEQLLAYANEQLMDEQLGPVLKIDAELFDRDLTVMTAEKIDALAPHGIGNHKPVFLLKNVLVTDRRTVGRDGQHLKLRLAVGESKKQIDGIGFSLRERADSLDLGQPVDVAVNLGINEWNGRRNAEVQVVDLRTAS